MLKEVNKKIVNFLDHNFYKEYEDFWDDKLFRKTVLRYIDDKTVMLDAGAGRGILPEMNFKGIAQKVVGIDPVEEVNQNPFLDEAHVGLADNMPFFSDDSFDVIVSDNVLEHVADPEKFYAEIARVLKKGGVFIAKTPNKHHYVPLIARITPLSFHKFYNSLRGREYEDTFPTEYKANTKKDQGSHGGKFGLLLEEMNYVEGRPEYLRMTFITYFVGIIYERLINTLNLNRFKGVLYSVMRKQ